MFSSSSLAILSKIAFYALISAFPLANDGLPDVGAVLGAASNVPVVSSVGSHEVRPRIAFVLADATAPIGDPAPDLLPVAARDAPVDSLKAIARTEDIFSDVDAIASLHTRSGEPMSLTVILAPAGGAALTPASLCDVAPGRLCDFALQLVLDSMVVSGTSTAAFLVFDVVTEQGRTVGHPASNISERSPVLSVSMV